MARTTLSRGSHKFSIAFKSGEFANQGSTIHAFWCIWNHARTLRGVWQLALSCWSIPSFWRKTILKWGWIWCTKIDADFCWSIVSYTMVNVFRKYPENIPQTILPSISVWNIPEIIEGCLLLTLTLYMTISICKLSIKHDSSEKKSPVTTQWMSSWGAGVQIPAFVADELQSA